MIEDKATEKLKEKARDLGLIVNAGAAAGAKSKPKSKDSKPAKKKG